MQAHAKTQAGLAFPLVRLIIGALVLLGLKEIAIQIPALQGMAVPWLLFSPAEWVEILIKTGVLALLVLTVQDVTGRLHRDLRELPVLARLVQLLGLLVILAWAYSIYLPLASVLLKDAVYLYQAVLILATVATGVGFAVHFLRGLNALSAALLDWLRRVLAVDRETGAEKD